MLKKLFNWILNSHRLLHVWAGLFLYFAQFIVTAIVLVILCIDAPSVAILAIPSLFTVFSNMCSVEYAQHEMRNTCKIDLLDILAGCLIPIILTILLIIFA